MRRPWPVFFLLAAALGGLVSLYLPWQQSSGPPVRVHGIGIFSNRSRIDAFAPFVTGDAAAAALLLLAALTLVALARPRLVERLPLGVSAVAASYFMVAVAVGARLLAHYREEAFPHSAIHYAVGTYVGLGVAVGALIAAAALRRPDARGYRSVAGITAVVIAGALLVALLLPETHIGSVDLTLGVTAPPGVAAAGLTLALIAVWPTSIRARGGSLVLTGPVLLFAAADLAADPTTSAPAYGAWLVLGLGAALLAVGLVESRRALRRPRQLSPELMLTAAVALLVGSFFLPWDTYGGRDGAGNFITLNAWATPTATATALLAVALVVVIVVVPLPLPFQPGLLSASVVFFAASLGLEFVGLEHLGGWRLRYGLLSGLSATVVVAATALLGLREKRFTWRPDLPRGVPVAACLAYLFFVVAPTWRLLPNGVQQVVAFAPLSWLTLAGAFGALMLIALWTRQVPFPKPEAWLIALPIVLLALVAVDLIRMRTGGISWGGGAVVGLLLLLSALGVVDTKVGLERLPFPEILRVDRL